MTGILLIFCIISVFIVATMYYNKVNIVKAIIFSITMFFFEYVIVSGMFFGADLFTINRALLAILAINIIVINILLLKKRKINYTLDYQRYLIPIVICVIMLPLVFIKYGFFGMGQDEGVYQTQAISFIYDNTKLQQDFQEYQKLESEDKEKYKISLEEDLIGLYNYDTELPLLSEEKELSDVSGVYHGVPTFSALLALWGSIFGLSNMAKIQTVFYICLIFLIFFICENLNLKTPIKIMVTFICAGSPIVIWVSKSSLTEIFLVNIFCSYIYQLTDNKTKIAPYLSVISILAFSFYHITIYTMIPVFILVYMGLYFYEKSEIYLKCCIISILGFMSGITMMVYTSTTYALIYNFTPLYRLFPFINQENVLAAILIISVLIIIGCLCIDWLRKNLDRLDLTIKYNKITILFWIFMIGVIGYQIKIFLTFISTYGNALASLQHMTIVGFSLLTGGIILPVSCILFLWKPQFILKSKDGFIVAILFIYCVLIYSCMFRKDINYYYYYARYLAPFIPIVALFAGIYMNRYLKKSICVISIVSIFCILPFDIIIGKGLDDTRVEWGILNDLSAEIEADSAVIIDRELMKYYYLPLQATTNADIYPVLDEDVERQIEKVKETVSNVYYITAEPCFLDNVSTVYYKHYLISEDNNKYDGKIIPFPLKFEKEETMIACYKYNPVQTEYSIEKGNLESRGLGHIEGNFSWINSKQAYFRFYLEKENYIMKIVQGSEIPFGNISASSVKVKAYVNHHYVGSIILNKENYREPLVFELSKENLYKGENIVVLESELWSASEVNSTDNRHLGISVKSFYFEEN